MAGDISQSRKNNAKKLDEDINKELPALKLENAKFQTLLNNLSQVILELIRLHLKYKLIQNLRWTNQEYFLWRRIM